MMDRSTLVLIAALLIFMVILVAVVDVASGASLDGACTSASCHIVRVVRDYQTLIAAGLALGAAWYAGRPVWLQLRNMQGQHDIMARNIIVKRLAEIEERSRGAQQKSMKLVHDAWGAFYSNDEAEYDPAEISLQWTHDAERLARDLASTLRRDQASNGDTTLIEEARLRLIARTKQLANCLASISAPARWAGDPDMTAEHELELQGVAERARIELEGLVTDLETARKEFASVVRGEVELIKRRIRDIDDAILTRPYTAD